MACDLRTLRSRLEAATKNEKLLVINLLKQVNVPLSETAEGVFFDLYSLQKGTLAMIKDVLDGKSSTSSIDRGRPPSASITFDGLKETIVAPADMSERLSDTQAAIIRNLRDCMKSLSKHKRVYVDKDYGVDEGDDATEFPLDDEELQDEVMIAVESTEEETHLDEDDTTMIGGEPADDLTQVSRHRDLETDDIDPDAQTIGGEDYVEHDDEEDLIVDEDEQQGSDNDNDDLLERTSLLHLYANATLAERFTHYRNLLEKTTPFGDCSGLGLHL